MFGSTNRLKAQRSNQAQSIGTTASSVTVANSVGLEGRRDAIVTRTIAPGKTGQIKFQGSWWTARCHQEITLLPGKLVYVMERQTLTLYVEPVSLNAGQENYSRVQ